MNESHTHTQTQTLSLVEHCWHCALDLVRIGAAVHTRLHRNDFGFTNQINKCRHLLRRTLGDLPGCVVNATDDNNLAACLPALNGLITSYSAPLKCPLCVRDSFARWFVETDNDDVGALSPIKL